MQDVCQGKIPQSLDPSNSKRKPEQLQIALDMNSSFGPKGSTLMRSQAVFVRAHVAITQTILQELEPDLEQTRG